jgi:hypothetical protein
VAVEEDRAVRRAGQPRAHEARGGVERLLGPGDRLAELPVAPAAHVASRAHAFAERRAAGRDVGEEAPGHHVGRVALRGARELLALGDGGQAALRALGVDRAQQRGADVLKRERRREVALVRTRRGLCGGRDGEDQQPHREAHADGFPATHVAEGARGPACAATYSLGGMMSAICGSSA